MESKRPLRVAICGTRGIPACYGGFETFAEELSVRLAELGLEVRVYGRSHVIDYEDSHYKGVEICLLPAPKHKYLETPIHSLFSFFHLIRNRVDVVLLCNGANSPFAWLPRLFGMPVIINVDGIERQRAKWNAVGKLWYLIGEYCSVLFASRVVSDAQVIAEYYRENYRTQSTVISYGHRENAVELVKCKLEGSFAEKAPEFLSKAVFKDLGLKTGKYVLFVSRLEPENNAHVVIDAYGRLDDEIRKEFPLVIVGDAPYADDYIKSLHDNACEEVVFAGYQFGDAYTDLQVGASVYVQATEVGGTHPALVESMGYANCIIVNGTPENVEVIGNAGLSYEKNDRAELAELLRSVLTDSERCNQLRSLAYQRANSEYCWEKIVKDYSMLFSELSGREVVLPCRDTEMRASE